MPELTLVDIANRMIAEVMGRGQTPLTFLMNGDTANKIAEDMASAIKSRMSIAQRLWMKLRGKDGSAKLTHLCGVPVTEAQHIPAGGLFLQCIPVVQPPVNQQNAAVPTPEFMEKVKAAPTSDAPTLSDLAQGNNNMPSVTDILIKALEGAEDLKQIIVIRVHRNEDVDMTLNCNQFEAHGVLQKAQIWLMHRGQ